MQNPIIKPAFTVGFTSEEVSKTYAEFQELSVKSAVSLRRDYPCLYAIFLQLFEQNSKNV